jgi:hypothetical protein
MFGDFRTHSQCLLFWLCPKFRNSKISANSSCLVDHTHSRRRAQTTAGSPLPPIPAGGMPAPQSWSGHARGNHGLSIAPPNDGPPELTPHRVNELLAGRTAVYEATEKDCRPLEGEDDKPECSICFEEFEPGANLARLQCFCRFHKVCLVFCVLSHSMRTSADGHTV